MKTHPSILCAAVLAALTFSYPDSFAGPAEGAVKGASEAVGASKEADKKAKDAGDAASKYDKSDADKAADQAAADADKAAAQADDSADKAAKAKRDADDAADAAKKAGKSDKDAAQKAAEEKKKSDAAEVDRKLDEENAKKKEKTAADADADAKKKDGKIEDRKEKADKDDARKKRKAARDAKRKAKNALRELEDLIEKRKKTEGGKPSSKTEDLQKILDGLRKAFGGGDQPPADEKKGIIQQAAAGQVAYTVSGTGETIGKVAQVLIVNLTDRVVETEIPPTMFIGGGNYQPYIIPNLVKISLAPFETKTVPVDGICQDARKPPSTAESGQLKILDPTAADFPKTVADQIAGAQRLQSAVAKLQGSGAITTPFSANPEKERETVIQQTFWIYTSTLNGRPYTKSEFANKLYTQGGFQPPNDLTPPVPLPETTVAKTPAATTSGTAATSQPKKLKNPTATQKQTLDKGVDQFWDAFQLTGKEAKVLD